jgi:hypothetical protein
MLRHLQELGDRISVPVKPDSEGFLGRECPEQDCLGYFKITPGTGIKVPAPCHCPYCGFVGDQNTFSTQEQIEYAQSYALREVSNALSSDLREWGSNLSRSISGGLLSIKVDVQGKLLPLRYYREKQLETEIVCDQCTLRYAIYGAFGFCPDCGIHNSLLILEKNLELASKQLTLTNAAEQSLADHLVGNALEDAVSAFDGFGRETCRIRNAKAADPAKAGNISFQNLAAAKQKVQDLFGVDLECAISAADWVFTCRCFQKRHLLAHKMGVVDGGYLNATNDPHAVLGRKINIQSNEVAALLASLRSLGTYLFSQLPAP